MPRASATVGEGFIGFERTVSAMKGTTEESDKRCNSGLQERFAPDDAGILAFDVPDAALEAAAAAIPGAAMSFPNSPTVSILFQCCSND